MTDLVGKTLSNRYRVDAFIGRGGMAEVYKVWDTNRMTYLAMKLLHEDLAIDRVFMRRFKREAQNLAKLQHPNIVRFYGLEQDGPYAFMLLDFIEGRSLKRAIFDAAGPMPVNQVRAVIRSICSALQFAHREGLTHCDIKPGNIMIDHRGDVLLSDFGIARMTDAATATMVGMGTPAYMAPEQIRGQDPSPRTDIYSLGITLFEMLTGGERPFTGEHARTTGTTSEKVRWEQINLSVPSPRKWNSTISPDLEMIVLRCMEKNPSSRYQYPLELLNALEVVLGKASEPNIKLRGDQVISLPQEKQPLGTTPQPVWEKPVQDHFPSSPGIKQSTWKRYIIPLIAGVAIISFGLGAVFFGSRDGGRGTDILKTTESSERMEVPKELPSDDSLNEFTPTPLIPFAQKVYENDYAGIGFVYPADWTIDEDISTQAAYITFINEEIDPYYSFIAIRVSLAELPIEEWTGDYPGIDLNSPEGILQVIYSEEGPFYLDSIDSNVESFNFSGYPAARILGMRQDEGGEDRKTSHTCTIRGNWMYFFSSSAYADIWDDYDETFKAVINSIQLMEPVAMPGPTPTEVIDCNDPIGCVIYRPGEPIRIASALVISGPNTKLGLDSQYGVEIAIDFKGEIMGHPIELQAEDDGCNAEGGQAAGQKIVSDSTIIAVVGTSCSGAAVPMAEVISEAGYVMVSPSNTAPSLTDPDQAWNPGYLRVSHNDLFQGHAMADFARNELRVSTAAAIHDGDPYTESLAQSFADNFIVLGGTITQVAAVDKGATDMRLVLSFIAMESPEFLFYPVFTAEGGFITRQAKETVMMKNTILAAADGMISSAAIEAVGSAGEGMYFSGPDLSYSGPLYDQVKAAYQQKYGSLPISVFHPHAFDAANMIFACIEDVGIDKTGTLVIGRQALRDCLYNTINFPGITGSLTCDQYGDCGAPKITINQLQRGEYIRIWP